MATSCENVLSCCEDDASTYRADGGPSSDNVECAMTLCPSGCSSSPANSGLYSSGSESLVVGTESGSVTVADIGFTPTKVWLQVIVPLGGDVIFAWPVSGTITTVGFDFVLNGVIPSAGYVLDYRFEP